MAAGIGDRSRALAPTSRSSYLSIDRGQAIATSLSFHSEWTNQQDAGRV